MYTIIIVVLIYSILIRVLGLYKKPKNILACGLFGACGLNIDYTKLSILGVANDIRGGDGNGYFNGFNLIKGIDKLKLFSDHIKDEPIVKNKNSNIFIGHTRKATHGVKTTENTHPFLIGEKGNQMVLAHNGQIFNTKEMCEKYDVDATGVDVDSKILAMLIHKVGAEKILSEYKGWAALVWTNLNEPGSVYIYHGKSKESSYSGAKVEEERPLFFIQLRNCIYFSSLIEPLKLIRETKKQKPFEVPHNRIIKLNNGKFSGKAIIINREETNNNIYKYRFPASTTSHNYSDGYPNDSWYNRNRSTAAYPPSRVHPSTPSTTYSGYTTGYDPNKPLPLNIHDVHNGSVFEMPNKKIFYWAGRYYYRNDKISGGQPTLVNGVLYVDKDSNTYEHYYPIFTEENRANNDYSLGTLKTFKQLDNQSLIRTGELQFFHNGIMLKNQIAYENLLGRLGNHPNDVLQSQIKNDNFNSCVVLSMYAKYPIVLLRSENIQVVNPTYRKLWYLDGKPANCTGLKPQMSDVTLTIEGGHLRKIQKNNDTQAVQLSLPVGTGKTSDTTPKKVIEETPFPDNISAEIDKSKQQMDAIKETSVYKQYMTSIDMHLKDTNHAYSVIDDILEKAIKNILTEYHTSKTAGFADMTVQDMEEFLEEKYVDFVTEEVVKLGLTIEDALDYAGISRATFFPLKDEIAMVMIEKFKIDGSIATREEEHDNVNEELEAEVEDQIEYLIDNDYIHKEADNFQIYEENDFSQEIAAILYKADDSLKSELIAACERNGKTSLVETIKKSKKILK